VIRDESFCGMSKAEANVIRRRASMRRIFSNLPVVMAVPGVGSEFERTESWATASDDIAGGFLAYDAVGEAFNDDPVIDS